MATTPTEQNPNSKNSDDLVDESIEETFPASDPPAAGGTTRIGTDDDTNAGDAHRLIRFGAHVDSVPDGLRPSKASSFFVAASLRAN